MGGPVDLFVLLQLPGDGVGSPLLILAVILAGLAALAAETPHDTPREGDAWLAVALTLSVFPFHFHFRVYRSVPVTVTVTLSGRVGDGVGGGVGGGDGGGGGGAGVGGGVDRKGGRSGSGSGRTIETETEMTARDRVGSERVSRVGRVGATTGGADGRPSDELVVVLVVVVAVVVVYNNRRPSAANVDVTAERWGWSRG